MNMEVSVGTPKIIYLGRIFNYKKPPSRRSPMETTETRTSSAGRRLFRRPKDGPLLIIYP